MGDLSTACTTHWDCTASTVRETRKAATASAARTASTCRGRGRAARPAAATPQVSASLTKPLCVENEMLDVQTREQRWDDQFKYPQYQYQIRSIQSSIYPVSSLCFYWKRKLHLKHASSKTSEPSWHVFRDGTFTFQDHKTQFPNT